MIIYDGTLNFFRLTIGVGRVPLTSMNLFRVKQRASSSRLPDTHSLPLRSGCMTMYVRRQSSAIGVTCKGQRDSLLVKQMFHLCYLAPVSPELVESIYVFQNLPLHGRCIKIEQAYFVPVEDSHIKRPQIPEIR